MLIACAGVRACVHEHERVCMSTSVCVLCKRHVCTNMEYERVHRSRSVCICVQTCYPMSERTNKRVQGCELALTDSKCVTASIQ